MIYLSPQNLILKDTVASYIAPEEGAEKREAADVRLCDFDDVTYHVQVSADNKTVLKVSMNMPCYREIAEHGAREALEKHFGGQIAAEPAVGYDVTLHIDLAATRDEKAKATLIDSLAGIKNLTIGGVFDRYFSGLLAGKAEKPFSFTLRPDTIVYLWPKDDRVTVIFAIDFSERVDKAIAKVFLQEFVEAKRRIKGAPPVTWDSNPPRELHDFGVTENTKGMLGYCSFAIQKSSIESGRKDAVVQTLQTFRNYIQYHIKCAKSYFHSRMRARGAALLDVLNRAKVEVVTEKKTASGKTFTRK